jgi:hypothetical protein
MDEWTAASPGGVRAIAKHAVLLFPTGMSDVAERVMRKLDCGDFIAAIDE